MVHHRQRHFVENSSVKSYQQAIYPRQLAIMAVGDHES
jgi:hypothetical protein